MQLKLPAALARLVVGAGGWAITACALAAPGAPASGSDLVPSAEAAAITRRPTVIDPSGDYRREVAPCLTGRSQQPRQACLEEARNARAARRSGSLALPGEDYLANALARCEPFAGEDRAACEARVLGFGNTSGSVAGGGLLRWVETVVLPPGSGELAFVPRTEQPVVVIPGRMP
jgi:hypothetical protein